MTRLARHGAIAALGLLCALLLLALLRAPAAWMAARIDVHLQAGESIVLGRHALAAPQADLAHLHLRRDADGRWMVRNASAARQLLIGRGGAERPAGTALLEQGQRLRLGAGELSVGRIADGAIELHGAGTTWRYDGTTVWRDGQVQPACPGARAAAALQLARPLVLGGHLHCGNRIGMAAAAPATARIAREDGVFVLAAPPSASVLVSGAAGASLLGRDEAALHEVSTLTLGHTRLAVQVEDGVLRLRPSGHVALLSAPQVQLPSQVKWQWRERNLWQVPATPWLVTCCCLALLLAGACAWIAAARAPAPGRRRRALAAACAVLLGAAGFALLAMQQAGDAPGAGIAVVLGMCALWALVLGSAQLRLVSVTAALLLGIGLLAQLELGLGAADSAGLRHVARAGALAAIGLGVLPVLACLAPRRPFGQAGVETLLLLTATLALAGLLLQAVAGDETGVLGVQPVEFAKLALVALTAHCLALAAPGASPASPGAWLRLLAPVALFLVLLAVALVQVDDYSPLVLLLVWAGSMAWAWAAATGKARLAGAIAAGACAGAIGVAALGDGASNATSAMQFYGERFQVWRDPLAHPHTGQQVLRAAGAVASGGTWGADRMLGLASLGQSAGEALRIPAVQDDFAPAFFLHRHGLAAAIVLWLLQALFLAALARIAMRSWQASLATREFRGAWLARLRCFALAGGAAFVAGHLLLSWGTNLAILPVMGQPMSFLSAGGSHLLLFICPLLVLAAASADSLEENPSCRFTSNMKPLAR